MARKRTRKALVQLHRALDPDDDLDPGLGELPDDLRGRLLYAVEDALRAVLQQPVIDGRGRRSADRETRWTAFEYMYMHPPPGPRGSHFMFYKPEATKDEPNKGPTVWVTKSAWAEEYVKYMAEHGVSLKSAEYLFDKFTEEKRAGRP